VLFFIFTFSFPIIFLCVKKNQQQSCLPIPHPIDPITLSLSPHPSPSLSLSLHISHLVPLRDGEEVMLNLFLSELGENRVLPRHNANLNLMQGNKCIEKKNAKYANTCIKNEKLHRK
jgi:hypothetical protein